MNKHFIRSLAAGLFLATAMPAQAAWYDVIKKLWPSTAVQPAQPQIEPIEPAAYGHPTSTTITPRPSSWYSFITSPLASAYAAVWSWFKRPAVQEAPQTRSELPSQELIELRGEVSELRSQKNDLTSRNNRLVDQKFHIETARDQALERETQLHAQNAQAQHQLQQFARDLNTACDRLERTAKEKLDAHERRLARIAQSIPQQPRHSTSTGSASDAVVVMTAQVSNPLLNSVTGDFHHIEKSAQANSPERELGPVGQNIQIDLEYAQEQARRGSEYARKLLSGQGLQEIPTSTQEDYLKSIIALNWFFYDKAIERRQAFEEGTFVIEDKDFIFYNFFMDYIKKVNPLITGTNLDPLAHYSDNPYGYSRDASHFREMKPLHRPYGIDIRLGNSGELPLLPALKKHMLFGIANPEKHFIYVKPENFGLYYRDGLPGHANEFFTAQVRKSPMLRNLLSRWGYNIGTDDAQTSRKERVPEAFIKTFAQAVKSDNNLAQRADELVAQARSHGIKTVTRTDIAQSESQEVQALIQQCRQDYDNIETRWGREVFLSNKDLLTHAGAMQ